MLLEITPQYILPWENSLPITLKSNISKIETFQSIPSEIGSWGSTLYLGSNDAISSKKSIITQSSICNNNIIF